MCKQAPVHIKVYSVGAHMHGWVLLFDTSVALLARPSLLPRLPRGVHMQGAATAEAGDMVMAEVCAAVKAVLDGRDPPPECLVQGK
jgi:hypothetical protein